METHTHMRINLKLHDRNIWIKKRGPEFTIWSWRCLDAWTASLLLGFSGSLSEILMILSGFFDIEWNWLKVMEGLLEFSMECRGNCWDWRAHSVFLGILEILQQLLHNCCHAIKILGRGGRILDDHHHHHHWHSLGIREDCRDCPSRCFAGFSGVEWASAGSQHPEAPSLVASVSPIPSPIRVSGSHGLFAVSEGRQLPHGSRPR